MNNFIASLSLRGKFLLITVAMLVPISVLTFISAELELEKIQVARHEDDGLEWASRLDQHRAQPRPSIASTPSPWRAARKANAPR